MENLIIISGGVGIICFIAGMILELFINAKELNRIKAELEYTRSKLIESQNSYGSENVEVIEINDHRVPDDKLFEPW